MKTSPRFSSVLLAGGGLTASTAFAVFAFTPCASELVFFLGALGTLALTVMAIVDLTGSRGAMEPSVEPSVNTIDPSG